MKSWTNETAKDIDCAIDDILLPSGVDTRNYAVPYWNEETGAFIWVSLVAYVAMIALDWAEQDTPCGLTRLLEFYKAPKSERKAIAAQLVADVSN